MEVNKRKFKIIIVLLVIIALIPPVVIMKEVMYWKLLAKDTEEKITQINASELETKLIEELEKTKLNVDNKSFNTTFAICDSDNINAETSYLTIYCELLGITNPYEGYILACITENKTELPERVYIPCFKVESDSNGKVQNIIYVDGNYFGIGRDLNNIVNNILREQYGIKSYSIESVKHFRDKYKNFPFGEAHYNYLKDINIYVTDDEFGASVLSTLCNDLGYNISEFEIKADLRYDKVQIPISSWK